MSNTVTVTATPATVARHARYALVERRIVERLISGLSLCENPGCTHDVGRGVVWNETHAPTERQVAEELVRELRYADFDHGDLLAVEAYEALANSRATRIKRLLDSVVKRMDADDRRSAIKEARLRKMGLYLR